MPLTLSYDLANTVPQHRNFIRSMLERFGWRRLGGSVFRYEGRDVHNVGVIEEDWLNDVVPSLMLFRSYVIKHNITLRFFTLDTASVVRIDLSDDQFPFGTPPLEGDNLALSDPTIPQAGVGTVRAFVQSAIENLA